MPHLSLNEAAMTKEVVIHVEGVLHHQRVTLSHLHISMLLVWHVCIPTPFAVFQAGLSPANSLYDIPQSVW